MNIVDCLELAIIGLSAASVVASLLAARAAHRCRERWIALGRRYGTERERRRYMAGRMSAEDLARLEARR